MAPPASQGCVEPAFAGLAGGAGGDNRQGAKGQWGLICSLGKGHNKEKEEAGERVGHSHDR